MPDQQTIHAATQSRLQIAHTALGISWAASRDGKDDVADIARRLRGLAETTGLGELATYAATLDEVGAKLAAAADITHAAIEIARGKRSTVPDDLRPGLHAPLDTVERWLAAVTT